MMKFEIEKEIEEKKERWTDTNDVLCQPLINY